MNRMKSFFILLAAVFCLTGATYADSVTSNGFLIVGLSPTAQVTTENCGASYGVCGSSSQSTEPVSTFALSVPGVSIPTGSTITGASLTFSLPSATASGGFSVVSVNIVDRGYGYEVEVCPFTCYEEYEYYNYGYSSPSYSVWGTISGAFTSLNSPDNSASLSGNGETLDLLALGFGSDLAAGDSLTLSGTTSSTIGWNTYPGYNSNSISDLFASPGTTVGANLEVDYTTGTTDSDPTSTPEPGTLNMIGAGLLGLVVLAKRSSLG